MDGNSLHAQASSVGNQVDCGHHLIACHIDAATRFTSIVAYAAAATPLWRLT